MEDPQCIVVGLPDEVASLRKVAVDLQDAADKQQDSTAITGAVAKTGVGGLVGGAMNAAAKLVETGVNSAAGSGFAAVAGGLTAILDEVQKPFDAVGADVIKASKQDLLPAMMAALDNIKFEDLEGTKLARAQFGESKGEAGDCAKWLWTKILLNAVLETSITNAIKKHTLASAWGKFISAYNGMTAGINKLKADMVQPIELNIADWTCKKIQESIESNSGKEEIRLRQAVLSGGPLPPVKCQQSFRVVFHPNQPTASDYATFKAEYPPNGSVGA